MSVPHGEQHQHAKLTEEKVLRIRYLKSLGVSMARLSRDYGVSHMCIKAVVTRQTWKHVPEEDLS